MNIARVDPIAVTGTIYLVEGNRMERWDGDAEYPVSEGDDLRGGALERAGAEADLLGHLDLHRLGVLPHTHLER